MRTVAGVFVRRADAERAAAGLESLGIPRDRITLLAPGGDARRVPTDEGERSGIGAALGAVTGAATGFPLGAAVTLLVPGVGAVIASGLIGAVLLGAGGAAIGATLEESLVTGLPRDELFFYEDALKQGRLVLIVQVENDDDAEIVRAALEAAGADSVDAARDAWWVGLRDDEARAYAERGGDFEADEPMYRHGFEAALMPFVRGRGYDVVLVELRRMYPEDCQADAFRCGFERGQTWDASRRRPEDRAA